MTDRGHETKGGETRMKVWKIKLLTEDEKEIATLIAPEKVFKTGNHGFGAYEKVTEANGTRYQCSLNIVRLKENK